MKKWLMVLLFIFYGGSVVYGQGSGVQNLPQGNKGYVFGAPKEKDENKAQETKERRNSLRGVDLMKGFKKIDKWIEENLW